MSNLPDPKQFDPLGWRDYGAPPPDLAFKSNGRFVSNPFSNLLPAPRPLTLSGVAFQANENRYVAAKTLDLSVRRRIAAMSPGEAKRFGRGIEHIGWEAVKLSAMWTGLLQIWTLPEKRRELAAMFDAKGRIVEWNNWGDRFWGCDIRPGQGEKRAGYGRNVLGRMLKAIHHGFRPELSEERAIDEGNWAALQVDLIRDLATVDLEYDPAPRKEPETTQAGLFDAFGRANFR
ncbi:MAG: NADAR family protein [Azospirillum sp.]|nr:NADAR family protein [Azospirillum sp.]